MLVLTVHRKVLAAGSALAYNYLFCYCFHIFKNHFQGAFTPQAHTGAGLAAVVLGLSWLPFKGGWICGHDRRFMI
jgi:hypothetical protein